MTDYEYFRRMSRIYDALADAESNLMCFFVYQNEEGGYRLLKNVRECFRDIEKEFEPPEEGPAF